MESGKHGDGLFAERAESLEAAPLLRTNTAGRSSDPLDLIRLRRSLSRGDLEFIRAALGWSAVASRLWLQSKLFREVMREARLRNWRLVQRRLEQQGAPMDAIMRDTAIFWWHCARIYGRGALHFAGVPASAEIYAAYERIRPQVYPIAAVNSITV